MITQTENTALLAQNSDLIAQAAAYKQLLADNGFPFTIDTQVLATTLRTQLFQKLLSIDKGLKMRWDMLRTDEARLRLIADTIDLNGYDVLNKAQDAVKALETAYNSLYVRGWGWVSQYVTFAQFADVCEMDLAVLLDSYTYDWTGKEHVLAYFQELGQKLAELRGFFRAGRSTSYNLHDTGCILSRFYTPDSFEGDVVVPDQGAVMQLVNDLEKAGKLALIPGK